MFWYNKRIIKCHLNKVENVQLLLHTTNYLLMTPNTANWDPHTTTFRDQEYNMTDYNGNVREEKRNGSERTRHIMSVVAEQIERSSIDDVSDSTQFIQSIDMLSKLTDGLMMVSVVSGKRRKQLTAEKLAKRLKIPIEMAKRTLEFQK